MRTFFVALALCANLTAVIAQTVSGAGASFSAPLYSKWAEAYLKASGTSVVYQSIGSGAGLRQIRGRMVDFGASDIPLSGEELQKDGLAQFPTAIGGVVPVVNLPGVAAGRLRLTGAVLADIYLGKIVKWNDAAIAALNPGASLPDRQIAVVRRADGAGTTHIFTSYLSKVSPEWKSKVGEGLSVHWPAGVGGKGNEGVAKFVRNLPNSIGYLEFSHARASQLSYTLLMNASGNYVAPGTTSFKAAAAAHSWERGLQHGFTNPAGKDVWPITGASYVIVAVKAAQPKQMLEAIRFFDWAYTHGSTVAEELGYAPLPESVQTAVRREWSKLAEGPGRLASAR